MLHDGARPNSPAAASPLAPRSAMADQVVTRFAPSPDRLPAHRRRAHGAVQLALRPPPRRQDAAAHRGHRPRALDRGGDRRRSSTASPGSASTGTATPSTSSPAPRATARSPRACSPPAAPITATRRPQELEEMREAAQAEGRPLRYDGRWRDRDPAEAPAGVKPVIRLKAPSEGETVDRGPGPGPGACGRTRISTTSCCCARTARRPTCSPSSSTTTTWASPTSSAATTISPTPPARRRSTRRWAGAVPEMAHIPLIHGPDGAKLSKRHGALGVDAYRDAWAICRRRCATISSGSAGATATRRSSRPTR